MTLICVVFFVVGIIFIIVDIPNVGLQICPTMLGGLMGILFAVSFFAERSSTLVIDTDKFVFPRGADINGKISFKKTAINKNEICDIESKFCKGDKIISRDCYFHTLKLKDGTKVTFTLYAFGKTAEKEILETIKKSVT